MSRPPANYHQLHRYLVLAMRLFVLCGTKSWKQSKIASLVFFHNSNSFGVLSHSTGFRAELLSDSLWFSGADPSWAAKRFRRRFHQGSSKVSPRFHQGSPSFVVSLVFCSRSALGCQKVPRKVPPRFHQFSSKVSPKVLQVSWCLWFSGVDPSWAAKRFRVIMSPIHLHSAESDPSCRCCWFLT